MKKYQIISYIFIRIYAFFATLNFRQIHKSLFTVKQLENRNSKKQFIYFKIGLSNINEYFSITFMVSGVYSLRLNQNLHLHT